MSDTELKQCLCGGTPKREGEAGFRWVYCTTCDRTVSGLFDPEEEDCIAAVSADADRRWNISNED